MRHTSLDESFWPSVAAALGSDAPLPDVETLLLDVSSLVDALLDASRTTGERVALLTLTSGESERAFGLALAALAARRGRRVLAADLDLSDDTWTRLLGGERLDGLADHLELGIPPARLVRATSWDTLWLLPAGSRGTDPDLLLRSGGVAACLESAARDRDLVCVGMPFRPWLEWGAGPTAGIRRAVLIGSAGDELAFELAMPRLLPSVELLGTVDVPPLGRWRPALGAALPSLRAEGAWTADVPEESRRLAMREPGPWGYAGAFPLLDEPDAGTAAADRSGTRGGRRLTALGRAAQASLSPGERAVPRPAGDDAEVEADVAFLSGRSAPPAAAPGLPGEGSGPAAAERPQARPAAGGPPAAGVHDPDAVRRTWLAWDERTAPEPPRPEMRDLASQWSAPEGRAPELLRDERGEGGRWGTTALVAFLCVFLGAGIYWTWRSSRPIPDGEFEFVDAGSAAVNVRSEDEAAGAGDEATLEAAAGEGAGPADGGAEAGRGGGGAGELEGDASGAAAGGELPEDPVDVAEPESSKPDPGADDEPPVGQGAGGAGRFAPPQAGPLRGFSLHVGSFQTREAAARAAAALRANGASAFVAPVLLEGKGQWHRVFADALPDRPAGEARLRELVGKGVVPEGHVRETPWALYLGTYASAAEAARASEKVARSGISAYPLGDGPVHLYAGAFETAADAELLNRELRDRGFEAELVRRRAGASR
jgi:cell division septation protein DedD